MNKTGKITAIAPNGTAEIKGQQFNRSLITLSNGEQWKFLSKGDFKKQIGDEIEYTIKNEQYKNAAFVAEPRPNFNNNGSRPASTNDSILLQVCYKENMQAFAKENKDSVMSETEKDFIALKQILNNL